MTVAVIGLGIMGGAYARNLIEAGEQVVGVDPAPSARAQLTLAGGNAFDAPDDWIADCDLIILSLVSPAVLAGVAANLATFLKPGQIVLETGTFALADKETARKTLSNAGAILLDCPVSGTGAQAATGDLVMMASGPHDAVEKVRPLLDKFTRLVINAGEFGDGIKLKFVANHAVAVHNVAAAETLNYADTLGLDRDLVYHMLSSGAGQSRMSDLRMPLMISGQYDPPTASLKMFEKDLRIIGEDIADNDARSPLFDAARAVYDEAFDDLPDGHDTAAIFEVYRKSRKS